MQYLRSKKRTVHGNSILTDGQQHTLNISYYLKFISASETQREDFSKDGRERFWSKGFTLALKVFLTQTSSSTKWQGTEKDVKTKREKQVQLRHPKKDKTMEFHQVLLTDKTNVKENQVLFAKLVLEEIMEMQTSILLLMHTMPMNNVHADRSEDNNSDNVAATNGDNRPELHVCEGQAGDQLPEVVDDD